MTRAHPFLAIFLPQSLLTSSCGKTRNATTSGFSAAACQTTVRQLQAEVSQRELHERSLLELLQSSATVEAKSSAIQALIAEEKDFDARHASACQEGDHSLRSESAPAGLVFSKP